MQLYADDTVLYVHAKTKQEAAAILSAALAPVSNWLNESCLHLNTKKTVCMFFSRQSAEGDLPSVVVNGESLDVMEEFKYLGVVFDTNLSFKAHVKKIKNIINFNLSNFYHIRPFLTSKTAKVYMHAMIFSHINYCCTTWTHTTESILKPIKSLFKKAVKILARKPLRFHYCNVLKKFNILDLDSHQTFMDACLIYKILNASAPPPLNEFIQKKNNEGRTTRAQTRGDCNVPRRRTKFCQMVLSVRGTHSWNKLPLYIRNCNNYILFKKNLKHWLRIKQTCTHLP